ncbi:MAG: helix-turn-helix domain-containing protein [Bacteroidota bacterium]|nr:helix-turn-helix domain-containing protein [Bacteroidota bacterium]
MKALKYKIIKSKKQYYAYCKQLETLLGNKSKSKSMKEEIELLTFLIEKWDNEHNSFYDADPVQLLKSLMDDRNMKPVSLAEMLGVSKGLVSDILNYKKGLSKDIIRKLADTFKLSHEAFNRHYDLIASVNGKRNQSKKVSSGRRVAF